MMNWYSMSVEDIMRYMTNNCESACYDLPKALIEKYIELSIEYSEYTECSENTIEGLQDQLKDLKDEIRTIIS